MHLATDPNKQSRLWILAFVIIFLKSNFLLVSLYAHSNDAIVLSKFFIFTCIYSITTTVPILLFVCFAFLFSRRAQLVYLVCLDLLISLLFMTDIVYARAFGHLISIYMLFAQGVTEDLGASIISLIKWTDFLFLLDLPFLSVLAWKQMKLDRLHKNAKVFAFAIIICILAIGYQFKTVEKGHLGDIIMRPAILSPLGNHLFDLYRFVYEKGYKLNDEDLQEVGNWLQKNSINQRPAEQYLAWEGSLKGRNLIVVQMESLEEIMVGQSYFGQEITPNINRLLPSSIYFNNIYEQTREGNSSDAELMFNTSIYPVSNGSTFLRFGSNTYTSFPLLLNTLGYTSVAIHGDDREYWNRKQVFPSLGFAYYVAQDEFQYKTTGGMGILDESLFQQSFEEVKQLKTPYYLFIISLTSHMPWEASALGGLELPYDDETCRYLQTINYLDSCFGEFYDTLEKNGLLENTVLVIYGDHEGIHKYFPTYLPENNQQIPFIIHVPGTDGKIVENIGGQVDMMPTLAYLMGINKNQYEHSVMGRNLLAASAQSAILPDGKVLGQVDDLEHLQETSHIADLIIRGNYFKLQ